jgi:hypothetical protein
VNPGAATMPIVVRLEPAEVAEIIAQRNRARLSAGRWAQLAHERELLLWLAIQEPASLEEAREVGRQIARHLREHGSQPPSVTA